MSKNEFLERLQQGLCQLPQAETASRLAYYEELLSDMTEDGMTEEAAVAKLGDPAVIARQILEETPLHTLVKTRVCPRNGWTTAAIVLAVLGAPIWLSLLIGAVSIVGSLYITVWALALSAYVTVAALILGGGALFLNSFVLMGTGMPEALLAMGGGLVSAALGLAGICAAWYLTLGILKGTRWTYGKIKTLFMK